MNVLTEVPDTIPDNEPGYWVVCLKELKVGKTTFTEVAYTKAFGRDQAILRVAEEFPFETRNHELVAFSSEDTVALKIRMHYIASVESDPC